MEIDKNKIDREIEGDNGQKIVILKGKVKDLVEATNKAYPTKKSDRENVLPLAIELTKLLVRIDGKKLTYEQINNLHISDWMKISEFIGDMMKPPKS